MYFLNSTHTWAEDVFLALSQVVNYMTEILLDGHRYKNTRIAIGEASALQRLRESLVNGRTAGAKRTLSASTNVAESTHMPTTLEANAGATLDGKGGGPKGRAMGASVGPNAAHRTSQELQEPQQRDASLAYSVQVPVLLLGGLSLPQDAATPPDAERRCVRLALQPNSNYASLTPVGGM